MPQNKKINATKLYRSEIDRVLGGVAGGLGEYFNVDPTILRVIFVLLGLNGGVLVYLILWLIIPPKSRLQEPSDLTLKSNADEIKVKAQALATDFRSETTKHNSRVWLGIAIIILGTILLLDNLDLFRFFNIWRFWPLAVIALGIALWAKKND